MRVLAKWEGEHWGEVDLGLIRMCMLFQKASLQAHTPSQSAAGWSASLCACRTPVPPSWLEFGSFLV